jgi:hypothetical protein
MQPNGMEIGTHVSARPGYLKGSPVGSRLRSGNGDSILCLVSSGPRISGFRACVETTCVSL